jgi:hypothetical protein
MTTLPKSRKNGMSLARNRRRSFEKMRKTMKIIAEARATLICARSKGLIPASNNAFPAVPDEAHIKAAVTTHRYPLTALLFPSLKNFSLLRRYYQVLVG